MRYRHAAALFFALAIGGCASGGTGSSRPLRVLVFNIHAGTDAKRVNNLERVAQLVTDTRADIVLLQEVDNRTRRSGKVDQLGRLRAMTGYHGVFGKTIDYDEGEYGLGILSRWPIDSDTLIHLSVDLPADAAVNYEARGALLASISTPSGMLRVINTHLEASRPSYRFQQGRALLRIAQLDTGATIIGGDFNDVPESFLLAVFTVAGWRDAFVECGRGSGLSFPADVPVKRIDYLLLSRGVRCGTASVPATQASDHRPVLVEVFTGSSR